jgi:mannose-6-phosphate isomerase
MEDPPSPAPPDPKPAASPPREEADPSPPPLPAPPRRLLRLRCAVQHYDWGRRGGASLVARLAGVPDPDPARPYAELWMGTHPSAPSTLLDDGELLSDWLARNPDALGSAVVARWGGDLPFLFKVLPLQVD